IGSRGSLFIVLHLIFVSVPYRICDDVMLGVGNPDAKADAIASLCQHLPRRIALPVFGVVGDPEVPFLDGINIVDGLHSLGIPTAWSAMAMRMKSGTAVTIRCRLPQTDSAASWLNTTLASGARKAAQSSSGILQLSRAVRTGANFRMPAYSKAAVTSRNPPAT